MFRPDACKTDKYGRACLEGRRRYPLGPGHPCERALVELGAFEAAPSDERGARIASFERAYGDAPTEAADPVSQLALLCRKPAGWRNSQVGASAPDGLRRHMAPPPRPGLKGALAAMRDASAQAGWSAAAGAMAALSGADSGSRPQTRCSPPCSSRTASARSTTRTPPIWPVTTRRSPAGRGE